MKPLKVVDFQSQLDEIDHARRHVGQSIAASGIALQRVLHRTDEATALQIPEPVVHAESESWPRGITTPSRRDPRVAAIGGLLVLVLLGAAIIRYEGYQRRPPQGNRAPAPSAVNATATATAPKPVSVPVPAPPAGEPFVIRVTAVRPSLVRIVVDGATLDWRAMKEGDEFVSRPEREIFIESSDAGALAATVNGKPTSLGADGRPAVFHRAR